MGLFEKIAEGQSAPENSIATLEVNARAARARGCVQMMREDGNSSAKYWGNCVDFPLPVAPCTITTRYCAMACDSSLRFAKAGKGLVKVRTVLSGCLGRGLTEKGQSLKHSLSTSAGGYARVLGR
jgi:hypothetical protein